MKIIDIVQANGRLIASSPITVIIPAHNAQMTIVRAIESVAAQTLLPLELICIDDGSSDNTPELVRQAAAHCAFAVRIVMLTCNRGAAGARNIGLELARGSIVAFLDADDVWHCQKLAIQSNLLDKHALDILGGHSSLGGIPSMSDDACFERVSLLRAMFTNPYHTSSVLVRRSSLVRFPEDGMLSEDYCLWLQLFHAGYRAGLHRQSLSSMFKHPFAEDGLSSSLLQMEIGELRALNAVRGPYRWLVPPAVIVSLGKLIARAFRTVLFRAAASA